MKTLLTFCLSCFGLTGICQEEGFTKIDSTDSSKIHLILEQMPVFETCKIDSFSKKEIRDCSNKKLQDFFYSNLKYPIGYCYCGKIPIRWVIEKDGSNTNLTFLREDKNPCEKEIEKVFPLLPEWKPGMKDGEPVRTFFTFSVNMTLEAGEEFEKEEEPEQIFINPEILPLWGSCASDSIPKNEWRKCSEAKLIEFIYGNFELSPRLQTSCDFQIRTLFQFVIEKNGKVTGLNFPLEIDSDIKEEITRIIKVMPDWIPGTQGGKPVDIHYTMPFRILIQ